MSFECPVVSIIIPCYNYAHLIIETLESVRLQTLESWECIVIDDGSSDNTREVVGKYLSNHRDNRFKYKRIKNGGTSKAKNYGLKLAKGTYIQFLDADDILSKDKLKIQSLILEKTNGNLVFSRSLFFYDNYLDGLYIQKYPLGYLASNSLSGYKLMYSIIKNNLFTISSPLVRYDLIKDKLFFDETINNNEDWLFWFEVAILDPNFLYDERLESCVFIRLHSDSAMNNVFKMFLGEIQVRKYFDSKLHKHLKKRNLDFMALHNIRSVDYRAGYKFVLKEFLKNPIQNISLLGLSVFKTFVRIYKNEKHED